MDNFAYLDQISASSRPPRAAKPRGLASLSIVKVATSGAVLFFLLMALGALLSNLNQKPTELTKQLLLQSTNLRTTLNDEGQYLKSSKLRAINTSLLAVLANTNSQLTNYLTENGKVKDTAAAITPSEKVVTAETAATSELKQSLTNARLNGILDRVYSAQITGQVSLLLTTISELQKRNKDTALTEILETYRSSLQTIRQGLETTSTM